MPRSVPDANRGVIYEFAMDRPKPKAQKAAAAIPPVSTCRFCYKPASARRVLVGDGVAFICGRCVSKFAKMLARHKRKSRKRRRP